MPRPESRCITTALAMAPLLAGAIALSGCVSMESIDLPALPSVSTPAHPPETETGWKELEAGNFDASRSSFEHVQASHPEDPSGPYGLGRVALAEGKREEAISHLQRAITLDAKNAAHWAYLGTAQLQLEQNEEAHASLLKALSLDSKQGQALVSMAEYALTVEVNYDKALQHLELAKASGYKAIPPDLEPAIRQRLN